MKCDGCEKSEGWKGEIMVFLDKEDDTIGTIVAYSGELVQRGAGHHDFIRREYGNVVAEFHNRFTLFYADDNQMAGFVHISGNEEAFSASGQIELRKKA